MTIDDLNSDTELYWCWVRGLEADTASLTGNHVAAMLQLAERLDDKLSAAFWMGVIEERRRASGGRC